MVNYFVMQLEILHQHSRGTKMATGSFLPRKTCIYTYASHSMSNVQFQKIFVPTLGKLIGISIERRKCLFVFHVRAHGWLARICMLWEQSPSRGWLPVVEAPGCLSHPTSTLQCKQGFAVIIENRAGRFGHKSFDWCLLLTSWANFSAGSFLVVCTVISFQHYTCTCNVEQYDGLVWKKSCPIGQD